MRSFLALCFSALMAGAAFAAPPPGIYDFQDQPDSQACAHVCADDTLCVAWTFGGPGKCGLLAAAPEVTEAGWVSGLSPNAPNFLRREAQVAPEATSAPQATPSEPSPPSEHAEAQPETEMETALLGGPEEGALRARLH